MPPTTPNADTAMKLLYFASNEHGGLADYAREQACALARRGVEIELVCAPGFPATAAPGILRTEILRETVKRTRPAGRLRRALDWARKEIPNHRRLAAHIRQRRSRHVLFAAYGEYFAPFWAPAFRALARRGVTFGAVVHDPIRDAVFGPEAWHRRSVADAYSFLRHAFVHEAFGLDTVRPCPDLTITVIPHGPFRLDTESPPREQARAALGLPPGAPVVLAFGHIRDNKNLDLAIEALAAVPGVHLLVAGAALSGDQKQPDFYRALAAARGVADRCHWHIRRIPEAEVGRFFAAADIVLLTYSRSFRSASGVLNVAAQFRRPCLASGGPGPLRRLVNTYELGRWVEPDSAEAVAAGLKELLASPPAARWDDYERDNSWEENARIVAETLFADCRV